jgi:phosphopantothenate synthetase
VTRAVPQIEHWVYQLKETTPAHRQKLVATWDNSKNLEKVKGFLSKRLNSLS